MPPQLALVLTFSLIGLLFWRESKRDYVPSPALWIPSLWLLILGSRSITLWLQTSNSPVHMVDYAGTRNLMEEGSPLDAGFFLVLMLLSLIALIRRRVAWATLVRNNVWLLIFFAYCGISTLWSDYSFISFKRWTKGLGDPLVMLVILTDPQPIKALETVIRRCAYLLLPISVLFVKYYPHLGKAYDDWTGVAMYTGITTNKNMLGLVCMICGLYFGWKLLECWKEQRDPKKKEDVYLALFFLCMIAYLINLANSKTSLMALLLGIGIMALLGIDAVKRRFGTYIFVGALMFAVLELSFDVMGMMISSTGRDSTLTGRTEIWDQVLRMDTDPLVGTGFESFWLGKRLEAMWDKYYFKPNQAHNGYIEVYLNLGWVGLCLLSGVLLSCYRNMRAMLASAHEFTETARFGRLGMGFLGGYLIYNYTEAAFKSQHFIYVVFMLFAIKYTRSAQQGRPEQAPAIARSEGMLPQW